MFARVNKSQTCIIFLIIILSTIDVIHIVSLGNLAKNKILKHSLRQQSIRFRKYSVVPITCCKRYRVPEISPNDVNNLIKQTKYMSGNEVPYKPHKSLSLWTLKNLNATTHLYAPRTKRRWINLAYYCDKKV